MPRKPSGKRPLTAAERSAAHYQRRRDAWERMVAALRAITRTSRATEAQQLARDALRSVGGEGR